MWTAGKTAPVKTETECIVEGSYSLAGTNILIRVSDRAYRQWLESSRIAELSWSRSAVALLSWMPLLVSKN